MPSKLALLEEHASDQCHNEGGDNEARDNKPQSVCVLAKCLGEEWGARMRRAGCTGSHTCFQWSRQACGRSCPAHPAPQPDAGPGSGSGLGRGWPTQHGAVDRRTAPPASKRSSHHATSACAVPEAAACACVLG